MAAAGWGLPAAQAGTRTGAAAPPDLSIGASQFPDDDAIILRWEQHWTLEKDGTVRRRDHKWLKLLSRRPIRQVADPRMDYHIGQDQLIIHTARTILANGETLAVPDYSFNKVGPDDVSGWVEYNQWEQTVISFSGIALGCVLELDYEVVTRAGVIPWLDVDLRLHQDYPTIERVVSVTVPAGSDLRAMVDGVTPMPEPSKQTADGASTYSWTFRDLAGARGEPRSLPWQKRCGRLRFTTCKDAAQWVGAIVERVDRAAAPTPEVKKFAEAVIDGEADSIEQIRLIAKKLHDSFNFVNSPKTFRSLECRDAATVLRSNYGNLLEAGALLAAALRSLGLEATPLVALDAMSGDPNQPAQSAFAGVVVEARAPEGDDAVFHVHPQHGVFRNPGHWGKHWLLGLDPQGKVHKTLVRARGEDQPSKIEITGKISLDAEGKATGDLRIRLTGAFYDPRKLETSEKQKGLIKGLAGRVLSDCKLTGHSIISLSDESLEATAKVACEKAGKGLEERRLLRLGDGPAFLPDFPMPLGRSHRRTHVHLAGRFIETVDIRVELPEDWGATITPSSLPPVKGSWGSCEQTVEAEGKSVRFRRTIKLEADTISPADFAPLRQAINALRAERSRILVAGKVEE